MGILNVTPDSFSDGGESMGVNAALRRAEALILEGADILDVGGESTRPGARLVPEGEELERVLPVVEALASRFATPISVDTRKAAVAQAALDAGAAIVNDVSALAFDPPMAEVVARSGAGVVLMHMRGTPLDMRERAHYRDLESEVAAELTASIARARASGIDPAAIVVDPGFGFAKNGDQSLQLLANLGSLVELGFPVLVGPSRKSFLGELLDVSPAGRVAGTMAACLLSWLQGAAIFRVHDVAPVAQALRVGRAVMERHRGPSLRLFSQGSEEWTEEGREEVPASS